MIRGEKVELTALSAGSVEKILKWVNIPEMKPLTGTIFPVSEFEHKEWILERAKAKYDKLFVIRIIDSETEIGTIGMKNTDFINGNVELFMSIGEERARRKGYGIDAINALANFCFNRLRLHKVFISVFSFNVSAMDSYMKVGFIVEGVLKEHCFINGQYYDLVYMSRIKHHETDSVGEINDFGI